MKSWTGGFRNERGVALPLALFVLVSLSVLVLAFLTMGGMEPKIARNLSDSTQARYVADAGIEAAYDQMAGAPLTGPGSWSDTLVNGGVVLNTQTLPGLTALYGTYTVTMRNDNLPNDNQISGQPVDAGGATNDTNNLVIVTATGTLPNGTTRQIQVVVRRISIPPMPGALNCGGLQCDLDMGVVSDWTNHHFHSSGLDYAQDPLNPANMVGVSGPIKLAIAVPPGSGTQTGNYSGSYSGMDYQGIVQNSLNKHQVNELDGLDSSLPPNPPTAVVSRKYDGAGAKTIASDPTLVSKTDGSGKFISNATSDFVTMLKAQPGVNVLKSVTGGGGVTIQDGTPNNPNGSLPVKLGTVQSPTISYFVGDKNPSNTDRVLSLKGTNSGAGILIVENGILQIYDSFRWDGIIIVTGDNSGVSFDKSVQANVYGGIMLNETKNTKDSPDYEMQLQKNNEHGEDTFATGLNDIHHTFLYSSSQRVNLAQSIRSLVKTGNWREM